MLQVPVPTPVTVDPATVQIAGVVLAKLIGKPDCPPVAESAPVPPTDTVGSAPNVMVCVP